MPRETWLAIEEARDLAILTFVRSEDGRSLLLLKAIDGRKNKWW